MCLCVLADSPAQIYEHHMAYCPTTMPQGSGWDKKKGSETETEIEDPSSFSFLILTAKHPRVIEGCCFGFEAQRPARWLGRSGRSGTHIRTYTSRGGKDAAFSLSFHCPLSNLSLSFTVHFRLLIAAAEECDADNNPAFIFDLVDVGREWLSIEPCNAAADRLGSASTPAALMAANDTMATVMADLDRLLGSSDGFLLGQWIDDARALAVAAGSGDADYLEWNARSQVTSW